MKNFSLTGHILRTHSPYGREATVSDSAFLSVEKVPLDSAGPENGLLGHLGHPPAVVIALNASPVSPTWS